MSDIVVIGFSADFFSGEGFGLRAVEALHAQYSFPENVRLVQGEVEEDALVTLVEEADILLLADSFISARPGGGLVVFDGAAVTRELSRHGNSLHQASLVLALKQARRAGRLPERVRFVGGRPIEMETYGLPLSEAATAQVEAAVAELVRFLEEAGIAAVPRAKNSAAEPMQTMATDLAAFESGCFA